MGIKKRPSRARSESLLKEWRTVTDPSFIEAHEDVIYDDPYKLYAVEKQRIVAEWVGRRHALEAIQRRDPENAAVQQLNDLLLINYIVYILGVDLKTAIGFVTSAYQKAIAARQKLRPASEALDYRHLAFVYGRKLITGRGDSLPDLCNIWIAGRWTDRLYKKIRAELGAKGLHYEDFWRAMYANFGNFLCKEVEFLAGERGGASARKIVTAWWCLWNSRDAGYLSPAARELDLLLPFYPK